MEAHRETLSKKERISSPKDISALISRGKFGGAGTGLRYCVLRGTECGLNRMMVSVPKKNFKRAVKRNLLKRRIRESFRKQKHAIEGTGTDILFIYEKKEIMTYGEIYEAVGKIIEKINGHEQRDTEKNRA